MFVMFEKEKNPKLWWYLGMVTTILEGVCQVFDTTFVSQVFEEMFSQQVFVETSVINNPSFKRVSISMQVSRVWSNDLVGKY